MNANLLFLCVRQRTRTREISSVDSQCGEVTREFCPLDYPLADARLNGRFCQRRGGLVSLVDYGSGIVMIRFFGIHREYDEVDAETV